MSHLKPKPEAADVRRPGHHRPRGRLLRVRVGVGKGAVHLFVQLPQESDRLEVLASAELVGYPRARLTRVVEVQHRRDRVDPQSVDVEAVEPEARAARQERPHLVAAVVEHECLPVGMEALARIGVLEQVGAVEEREPVLVAREVGRDPVEDDADPGIVQLVDERHEVGRRAVPRGRREVASGLVAPRPVERMLHDREQLDVREPGLLHVLDQARRDLAVRAPAPVLAALPRTEVELVDRDRRVEPVIARRGTASTARRATRSRDRRRPIRCAVAARPGTRTDRPSRPDIRCARRSRTCRPRPATSPGTARSRCPNCPTGSSASAPRVQPLPAPSTDTRCALGAHTEKRTPSGSTWAPRRSYRRKCRPSLNRWRSSEVSTVIGWCSCGRSRVG